MLAAEIPEGYLIAGLVAGFALLGWVFKQLLDVIKAMAVLREQTRHDRSWLTEHEVKLDAHGTLLAQHGERIDEHGRRLDSHDRLLDRKIG